MQLLQEPPVSMGTTRQRLHGAPITGGAHSVQRNVQWSTEKERASQRYGNDKRENTIWEMWTWSQNGTAFTKLLFYIVLFLGIAANAETSPF